MGDNVAHIQVAGIVHRQSAWVDDSPRFKTWCFDFHDERTSGGVLAHQVVDLGIDVPGRVGRHTPVRWTKRSELPEKHSITRKHLNAAYTHFRYVDVAEPVRRDSL